MPARLAGEKGQQLRGGAGLAEQLSLREVARVPAQEIQLPQGLDTFGDDFHAEAASHLDDGFHDRRIAGVLAHVAYERLVDLQRADGELLQRRERRVARAEVVDRQVQAHRIQLIQQPHGALRVRHQRGFGDLQLERGRRDPVTAEHRAAAENEARLAQLLQ